MPKKDKKKKKKKGDELPQTAFAFLGQRSGSDSGGSSSSGGTVPFLFGSSGGSSGRSGNTTVAAAGSTVQSAGNGNQSAVSSFTTPPPPPPPATATASTAGSNTAIQTASVSTSAAASVSTGTVGTAAPSARRDVFTGGADMTAVGVDSRSWYEILSDISHWTPFPFSLGMEMELIICNDKGDYITGEDMVYRMEEITKEATKLMNQLINYELNDPVFPPMPEYIRSKIGQMAYNDTDPEKGLTMKLNYRNDFTGEYVTVDAFGRDGNVTAITYILELVTPVCAYAEELAYWASTLFNIAKKTLPKDLHILSCAMNPAQKEYNRGLSHGDHNHIGGFTDNVERAMCYDMIRNFIPHIIGLSVNSPIINNRPTDVVKTRVNPKTGKIRYTAPNCVRSLRLKNNTTMLSSNDPKHYIPYLSKMDEEDKKYMLQVLQKLDWYDARYQDVFPLTDFGTIEVRIMDAQISICRRIGLAMLNLALCYKARKLLQQGKKVPNVNSETLVFNRKGAIERGLISIYKGVNISREELDKYDPEFSRYYLGPKERPYRFLFEAVQGMFHYLKEELKELGFLYSPFLKPVLQSVFGEISYADIPMTEAEYQLSLYDYKMKNGEEPNILRDLLYFTLEYSKDPLNNPLTGELTLPKSMLE